MDQNPEIQNALNAFVKWIKIIMKKKKNEKRNTQQQQQQQNKEWNTHRNLDSKKKPNNDLR